MLALLRRFAWNRCARGALITGLRHGTFCAGGCWALALLMVVGLMRPAWMGALAIYFAPEAVLIGRVKLGEHASVWSGAVIRADNEPITVGARCNVQEGAVLHADPGFPLQLADDVTVGHQTMLHGCSIGEGSLIGIQAVVLNGAVIGRHCLVAAGAIVTEGKRFPDRSLILGAPAKVVRELSDEDVARLTASAADYAVPSRALPSEPGAHRLTYHQGLPSQLPTLRSSTDDTAERKP